MTQHDFTNALKSLFNIDGYQLPELTHFQKSEFLTDPVRYLMRCEDAQADAIWREVEKRQPPKATFADIPIDDLARSSAVAGWHPGDEA